MRDEAKPKTYKLLFAIIAELGSKYYFRRHLLFEGHHSFQLIMEYRQVEEKENI